MASGLIRELLTITASARPKRIAVLVDPDVIRVGEVDIITQRFAAFWGGAYWPIIPTDGSDLSDDWWRVLTALDPDLIYSFCNLSQSLHDRIQRRIAPSQIVVFEALDILREEGPFNPDFHEIAATDIYDIVLYHAQRRWSPTPARFLYLVDSPVVGPDRPFALRNFGVIRPFVQSNSAFSLAEHERLSVGDTSKRALLERFLTGSVGEVTPRDLSRLYAPRPFDLEFDSKSLGFHLVVGDSVDDVLLAWNRAMCSDGHAGRDVLWIDSESARDAAFLEIVGQWIARTFFSNQNQRSGLVISHSESAKSLQEIAASISKTSWLRFESECRHRGQFPVRPRSPASGPVYPSFLDKGPRVTEQVPFADNQGQLALPHPPFATGSSHHDGWMVDLDVEYSLDPPRYTNQSDSWRLPRRSELGHLFAPGRPLARIVANGLPSIAVAAAERAVVVRVPAKHTLLHWLLQPSPPLRTRRSPTSPPSQSRFQDVRISEQGRRFRGMIELFGSVTDAGRLFEDDFWRTTFLELAGKPTNQVERSARMVAQILDGTPTTTTDERLAVGRSIAKKLFAVRPQQHTLDIRTLKGMFRRYQGRNGTVIATDGPEPVFDDFARHELEWLIERKVLLQGVGLKCPKCGISQWRIVDALSRVMQCDGCTSEFVLPPEPRWEFRLNDLVSGALARDGILPLLNAVHDPGRFVRDFVLVIPPQELRESPEGDVFTDLDIVMIRDGRFVIGEVKSNPTAFDASQLDKLGAVAEALRPDVVVLAASGTDWPENVMSHFDRFRTRLAALEIQVETSLLAW